MNSQDIESEFTRGVYSSRDIRLANPKWLLAWPQLKDAFGMETGLNLEISTTYRSPKAQNDLYQIGRSRPPFGKTVTDCDGKKLLSKHNLFPSKAIDVYVHSSGKAIWDESLYLPIGPLAKRFGLVWGIKLRNGAIDLPHLEIPD